jgi:isopenicillin N synthase-like dioxygenase
MDNRLPIIDVGPLLEKGDTDRVADEIGRACERHGFFYVAGHGISEELQLRLEDLSRQFFAQDLAVKQQISMNLGGLAWRGFFAVGDELTSGKPDQKEGIYFGTELLDSHPMVRAKTPLHGKNLFPRIPGFREAVLETIDAMTTLGHAVLRGIALSLGLAEETIHDRWTYDPTILFRIFHYPPLDAKMANQTTANQTTANQKWSVGEHTDYGLLTLLSQDDSGGLQVKTDSGWMDAPPISGTFVCNIGDMLDRVTGGRYRSTPHRVFNSANAGRLSFPFFFDPAWDASIGSLLPPSTQRHDSGKLRWDKVDLQSITGTYGDYLVNKVSRVFPELAANVRAAPSNDND